MNKRSKMLALLAVGMFSVMALGITGCSSQATVAPDNGNAITGTYNTFDLMGYPVDFYDGTVDVPMMERPDPNTDKGSDHRKMRTPFADLLRHLKLSDDQVTAVKEIAAKHSDCVHSAINALRASGREIIAAARAERQAIIDKAHAGEITREEAAAAIHELNKRTREALKNGANRERVREIIKGCDDEFLASLGSILTEEQAQILRDWMAKRADRGTGKDHGPRG
ncbi:MAG: hypothetical protein HQ472_09990 [Ignavibacteria bacterium]|nr:hypothetical protein [Ignavibacteria bacterium]